MYTMYILYVYSRIECMIAWCHRYSVRAEGDAVREHDRILLESCRFKVGESMIDRRAKTVWEGC
jgi:hypothetical protein